MTTKPDTKDKTIKREGVSAVWLVPAIALIFGAWLVFKAFSEQGVFITVQFPTANGISIGKTEVKYKGITIGKVSSVDIADDINSVNVEIEMLSRTEKRLTNNTEFWLVTADVSFQGVTGLDTLLSGSYIGVEPDIKSEGKPQRHFVALEKAPPLSYQVPGLHIELEASSLGSLSVNSMVSFKKMPVGHISDYAYNPETDLFNIQVFIKPDYVHLVKENSKFWSASGVEISGSLTSGLTVRTESIASIVAGGVSFDASEFEPEMSSVSNGAKFSLYDDFSSAEMGHEIDLVLKWNSGIDVGSSIMYQGLLLGKVSGFKKFDPAERVVLATAKVNPRIKAYLTSDSSFFVVSPKVDLSGVSNLNSLAFGTHIALIPSINGEAQTQFNVYSTKPAYKYSEPGLHLVLKANEIGSLHQGTGVFYKQKQVGTIQAIEGIGPDDYLVHIHILPEYQNYVDSESRFWNASGVNIKGGLQDLDIQVQSMQTLLAGGIAFDKGRESDRKTPSNGDGFNLFSDEDVAKERVDFVLTIPESNGIDVNTRIMYRGQKIGSVHVLNQDKSGVILNVGVLPKFEYLLKDNSIFWVVKPILSLSGLSDTDALFGGAYISLTLGSGEPKYKFHVYNTPPAKHISVAGLQLVLSSPRGNVVSPGSPISYRGITVGQVDNVALSDDGLKVDINITVDQAYSHLVNSFTRFYNASGITVAGGISGMVVKTESADAMLRGGISLYNPEVEQALEQIAEGSDFTLFDNIEHAESAGVAVKIVFQNAKGLTENLKIKYQDHEVGFVERIVFDESSYGATAFVYLDDIGRKFAVDGSKFWLARSEFGLAGNKNLGDILSGGFIGVLPGAGSIQTEFKANNIAPVIEKLPYGLNLTLSANERSSLSIGDPILYRQIRVGEVIGVGLDSDSSKVNVFINIDDEFKMLVTSQTKFWNTSGIEIEAGLFSGVTIDSESLETLLSGGIAFATPEAGNETNSVDNGQGFTLYPSLESDWKEWKPIINR
ncbi:MlaD family protein [Colwelliaceae bacterium BS250]